MCRGTVGSDLGNMLEGEGNLLRLFLPFSTDTIIQRGGRFGSWAQAKGS